MLQVSEQEKANLRKLINDKQVAENDTVDGHVKLKEDDVIKIREISDLEAKVKFLTDNLELTSQASAKLGNLEGIVRIFYIYF